jgi:hypothetical protein
MEKLLKHSKILSLKSDLGIVDPNPDLQHWKRCSVTFLARAGYPPPSEHSNKRWTKETKPKKIRILEERHQINN